MAGRSRGQVYSLTGRLRREGGSAGPQGAGISAQEGLALVRSRGDEQENCKHKCAGKMAQTRGAGTTHSCMSPRLCSHCHNCEPVQKISQELSLCSKLRKEIHAQEDHYALDKPVKAEAVGAAHLTGAVLEPRQKQVVCRVFLLL